MSKAVDIFCHIPKTAGSTLCHLIRSQYGNRSVLDLYGDMRRADSIAKVKELPEHVRVIVGHLPYSFRQHVPGPSRCFAVFREPVDCILSEYYYIRQCVGHHFHEQVMSGEMTLADCAANLRNRQICWIAGVPRKADVPSDELLAMARENLATNFAAFGLTERFDETIVLFNETLGWKVEYYIRLNTNQQRPSGKQIATHEMEALAECAQLDKEFYRFASDLFEERLRGQEGTGGDRRGQEGTGGPDPKRRCSPEKAKPCSGDHVEGRARSLPSWLNAPQSRAGD